MASLVPAATDLIVGMSAADHLVAVSSWETNRPEIQQLSRVGDYQTTDWEKLAELRPDIMVVFMNADRLPPGLTQRADDLHIKLVNLQSSGLERLDDVFKTSLLLGDLIKEPQKAADLSRNIRAQLDAVAKRVSNQPKIRTLIARDEEGFALIAGDTFIDDLLTIAGGTNVAGNIGRRYPNVDREQIIEMSPQVIIQLIPDATPQVIERARKTWEQLPDLPAVQDKKVFILTDWYVIQPGSHVGDLATKFADILHPAAAP
ncbi:MAG TPA: helical backbone metal receptor [Tepidisphaeraceae bacterium]|nr:helical backbone metal receptor [Tepidisphaeraceae bacterium]